MGTKTALIAIAFVVFAAAALLIFLEQEDSAGAELLRCLKSRGRVAVVGEPASVPRVVPGTEMVSVRKLPEIAGRLNGSNIVALREAMEKSGVTALLAEFRSRRRSEADASIRAALEAYEYISGLQAVCVGPSVALYTGNPIGDLPSNSRHALAGVARGLLEGAESPRAGSFPEPLRLTRNVEVMVMLLQRDAPRLWRSARGSSIAAALISAAKAARRRWIERERVMGGRLDDLLPTLDIQVSLLLDDGILLSRDGGFIDRVFTPVHGVAFESRGSWQYLLPDATRSSGGGSATRAYRKLLEAQGMRADSYQRPDLRLYRLAVVELARSAAPVRFRR